MKPLISIIVPVYNAEDHLAECLDSLLKQSYRPLEIIPVENGSTDNSAAICLEYQKKHSLIHMIQGEGKGANHGRWEGICASKGEFILCCDSDDITHPDLITMLYHAVCQSGFPCACCPYDTFSTDIPEETPFESDDMITKFCNPDQLDALLHNKAIDWGLWNKLYLKEMLCESDFLNGITYNEDLLTNWLVLNRMPGLALIGHIGYHYRQHDASVSRKPLTQYSLNDQKTAAELILKQAEGSVTEESAFSFYYEKLLYLYSMILRQQDTSSFAETICQYRDELRQKLPDAMKNSKLSYKMKLSAQIALLAPGLFAFLCKHLLEKR